MRYADCVENLEIDKKTQKTGFVIHGDIKPDNIVFEDDEMSRVKLVDFNKVFPRLSSLTQTSTPLYTIQIDIGENGGEKNIGFQDIIALALSILEIEAPSFIEKFQPTFLGHCSTFDPINDGICILKLKLFVINSFRSLGYQLKERRDIQADKAKIEKHDLEKINKLPSLNKCSDLTCIFLHILNTRYELIPNSYGIANVLSLLKQENNLEFYSLGFVETTYFVERKKTVLI